MLAEHLHDMAVARQMVVFGQGLRDPGAVGDVEHRREPVGCGLVRSEQAKVMVLLDHVAQEDAHDPRRLAVGLPRLDNRDRVIGEVWHDQLAPQQSAIGVRVCAHPPVALGC